MNVSATQSATAYGYGQLQRQVAQRNAEQLEAKAAALSAQAASARKAADDAERRAQDLEIQSGSARTAASNAELAVAASEGAMRTARKITEQADRILHSMQTANDSKKLYGSKGGSSSYTAGSIVNVAV